MTAELQIFLGLIVGLSLLAVFRLLKMAVKTPIVDQAELPADPKAAVEAKLHELQELNHRALDTIQTLKMQLREMQVHKSEVSATATRDLNEKLEARLQDLFSEVEQIYRQNKQLSEFQRLAPKLAAILADLQPAPPATPDKKPARNLRAVKK